MPENSAGTRTNFRGTYISLMSQIQYFCDFIFEDHRISAKYYIYLCYVLFVNFRGIIFHYPRKQQNIRPSKICTSTVQKLVSRSQTILRASRLSMFRL